MRALSAIERWPVERAAAGIVREGELVARFGDVDEPLPLASVTKLLTATAALLSVEEGILSLDSEAGPEGSTIRHLLSHASGLAPDADQVVCAPGTRRIYSNRGYEVLALAVGEAAAMPFEEYLSSGVTEPLGMAYCALEGSPAHGADASVSDLAGLLNGLDRLLAEETRRAMTTIAWPSLAGVLPGFGRQEPNPWGLGPEIRGAKSPHWTGSSNSERTWGHFGRAGTMAWVDPEAGIGLVALTDREFGPWAAQAWPALSDAVLEEWAR